MIQTLASVVAKPSQGDFVKNLAETGQALATIAALIIGGIWTYILFVRKRQRFPRATVAHSVTVKRLLPNSLLLHLAVRIQNVGEVILRLRDSDVQLYQVVPLDADLAEKIRRGEDPVQEGEAEVDWPLLGRRECDWQQWPKEIEPGEHDEFHYDFVISDLIVTISAYSHFRNVVKKRKPIGWNWTTFHETVPTKGGAEHAESKRREAHQRPGSEEEPPKTTTTTTEASKEGLGEANRKGASGVEIGVETDARFQAESRS